MVGPSDFSHYIREKDFIRAFISQFPIVRLLGVFNKENKLCVMGTRDVFCCAGSGESYSSHFPCVL